MCLGSTRILLNYGDTHQNSFHRETCDDNKEEYLLLPFVMDMVSTFSTYHQDCTTHTTKPVAHVAYKIVFQNVLYMTNLAYLPWSSRHRVETETISNSVGLRIL